MNEEYDITKAFQAIEDEIIASMIRNLQHHRTMEEDEEKLWSQWQVKQLKALEKYKVRNQKKYTKQFQDLNKRIEDLIKVANETGSMEQEIEILEAIKNGFQGYHKASSAMQGEFFKLNERKLEALIKATTDDMEKAETAVLRMANDQYRKVIFNAQTYANTGAATYEKAVDMATKDFLKAGLNCVEYTNGARHKLSDYVDMAIRTASKRAYLQGEGTMRQNWGIATVIVNKRGNPCPKCLPFCGKVLIDDVWSGGKAENAKYPLMSYAISKGLYHPRCKDSHTTYFPGISSTDDTWTKEELKVIGQNAKAEAKQQYAQRQTEKFERLGKYALDEENKEMYQNKAEQWEKEVANKSVIEMSQELISPAYINPVNPVTNQEKVDALTYDFINGGYKGRPIVAVDRGNGEYQALTGSHRIYAARKAAIEIPVHLVEADEDIVQRLLDAGDDEERLEIALSKKVDNTTRELLEKEIDINAKEYRTDMWKEKAKLQQEAEKIAQEEAQKAAMIAKKEAEAVKAKEKAAREVSEEMKEYREFYAEMKSKYGEHLYAEMSDAEYDKLEKLERIAYKGR